MVTYKTREGELRTVSSKFGLGCLPDCMLTNVPSSPELELQENLEASEKLMATLNESWEDKMTKTAHIHLERERALEDLGIMVEKNMIGVHAPRRNPHLVNLNEDPMASECLVYQLKPGRTTVGCTTSDATIKLSGQRILDQHCAFENNDSGVTLETMPDALVLVNGARLVPGTPIALQPKDRVIVDFHVFRYSFPDAVRAQRREASEFAPELPDEGPSIIDWTFARQEASSALRGSEFERLNDDDLDVLFQDLVKVKTSRNSLLGMSASSSFPDFRRLSEEEPSKPESTDERTTRSEIQDRVIKATDVPVYVNASLEVASDTGPTVMGEGTAGSSGVNLWKDVEREAYKSMMKKMASDNQRLRQQSWNGGAKLDTLTAREIQISRRSLVQWRLLRTKRVSAEHFGLIPIVREANKLAAFAEVDVSYEAIIAKSTLPPSSKDSSRIDEGVNDPDAHAILTLIRVRDHASGSVYHWNPSTFRRRFAVMQNVSTIRANARSLHFRISDAFTADSPPMWSHLGKTTFSLSPLSAGTSLSAKVPIMSSLDGCKLGHCRVQIKPCVIHAADPRETSTLCVDLTIDQVQGISFRAIEKVYAQIHPRAILGPETIEDTVMVSLTTSGAGIHIWNFQTSITASMTIVTLRHLQQSYGDIHFFATPREGDTSGFLDLLSRPPPTGAEDGHILDLHGKNSLDSSEHMLTIQMEILELGPSGDYIPVDVAAQTDNKSDIYRLRQGNQRRIRIRLLHNSGQAITLKAISETRIGKLRVNQNGRSIQSREASTVDLASIGKATEPIRHLDGGSTLETIFGWDSSAHANFEMDKPSPSGHVYKLELAFQVDLGDSTLPVRVRQDFDFQMLRRDARRGLSVLGLFRSRPPARHVTTIHNLALKKEMSSGLEGESGNVSPAVADCLEKRRRVILQADLANAQDRLSGVIVPLGSTSKIPNPKALLSSAVEVWKSTVTHKHQARQGSTLDLTDLGIEIAPLVRSVPTLYPSTML